MRRSVLLVLVLVLVLVLGCGNVTAPPSPDAPPDMPLPNVHRYYVMDHQIMPRTEAEAMANALDLNGDGTTDNRFGQLLLGFSSDAVVGATNTAVDRGTIIQLFDLAVGLNDGDGLKFINLRRRSPRNFRWRQGRSSTWARPRPFLARIVRISDNRVIRIRQVADRPH